MLTAEQKMNLHKWRKDPDPLHRLTTDYYRLERHLVKRDYEKLLAQAEDHEQIADAKKMFFDRLAALEQQYRDDIKLSCTIHLMQHNLPAAGVIYTH